ncbi:MAG: hypothetical protein AAF961_09605, partial [Planctomycetota bacterium]
SGTADPPTYLALGSPGASAHIDASARREMVFTRSVQLSARDARRSVRMAVDPNCALGRAEMCGKSAETTGREMHRVVAQEVWS